MRITGGVLRSRRLSAPTGDAARPTSDRVREALFSSLSDVAGLRVLDLFAGSGALGLGALSRGAEHAVFVERVTRHTRVIKDNVRALELKDRSTVLGLPVERARRVLLEHGPFDLVFADPPYAIVGKLQPTLETLLAPAMLTPDARLIFEHDSRDEPLSLATLECVRTRRYGSTALSFYRMLAATDAADDTSCEATAQ